jgi:GTP-binding protein HflX
MSSLTEAPRPKAVLVGVQLSGVTDAEQRASLMELKRLCKTLGFEVVGEVTQKRKSLGAAALLGEGKLVELAAWTGGTGVVVTGPPGKKKVADEDDEEDETEALDLDAPPAPAGEPRATVVVVDHELSPRQLRHIERATSAAAVLDRTGVIIEIFHRHASSRPARLQVEIARLTYVAPRLRETGGGERQRGGIGQRGAGESSVELDRRKIRDRISELKTELAAIDDESKTRRARRQDALRVALVGYTNSGKSTLMNALTHAGVLVADQLFATLDPTVRLLRLAGGGEALLVDTVGFIHKLPHGFVDAFKSTLEEVQKAHLLLHVVDASDAHAAEHIRVVEDVLAELGADATPCITVFNKQDLPGCNGKRPPVSGPTSSISARTGAGIDTLLRQISTLLAAQQERLHVFIPVDRGDLLAVLHQTGRIAEQTLQGGAFEVTAYVPPRIAGRIRKSLAEARG